MEENKFVCIILYKFINKNIKNNILDYNNNILLF